MLPGILFQELSDLLDDIWDEYVWRPGPLSPIASDDKANVNGAISPDWLPPSTSRAICISAQAHNTALYSLLDR